MAINEIVNKKPHKEGINRNKTNINIQQENE